MHKTVNTHQYASSSGHIFEAIKPLAVLVGLVNAHRGEV